MLKLVCIVWKFNFILFDNVRYTPTMCLLSVSKTENNEKWMVNGNIINNTIFFFSQNFSLFIYYIILLYRNFHSPLQTITITDGENMWQRFRMKCNFFFFNILLIYMWCDDKYRVDASWNTNRFSYNNEKMIVIYPLSKCKQRTQ